MLYVHFMGVERFQHNGAAIYPKIDRMGKAFYWPFSEIMAANMGVDTARLRMFGDKLNRLFQTINKLTGDLSPCTYLIVFHKGQGLAFEERTALDGMHGSIFQAIA